MPVAKRVLVALKVTLLLPVLLIVMLLSETVLPEGILIPAELLPTNAKVPEVAVKVAPDATVNVEVKLTVPPGPVKEPPLIAS